MSKRNSSASKVERRQLREKKVRDSSHRVVYVPLQRKSSAGVKYTSYKKVVDVKK